MIPYVLPLGLTQLEITTGGRDNFYGINSSTISKPTNEEGSIPSQLRVCLAQPNDPKALSVHPNFFVIANFEVFLRQRNPTSGDMSVVETNRLRWDRSVFRCCHLCIHFRQHVVIRVPHTIPPVRSNCTKPHNICVLHIFNVVGAPKCPDYIQEHFKGLIATKSFTSSAENGIFFNRKALSFLEAAYVECFLTFCK